MDKIYETKDGKIIKSNYNNFLSMLEYYKKLKQESPRL